jgi:hypothetical protein
MANFPHFYKCVRTLGRHVSLIQLLIYFDEPTAHGTGRLAKNASNPWRHSSDSRGAALAWAASSSVLPT